MLALLLVGACFAAAAAVVWAWLAVAAGVAFGLAFIGFLVPTFRRPPQKRYDLITDDLARRIEPHPSSPHREPYRRKGEEPRPR